MIQKRARQMADVLRRAIRDSGLTSYRIAKDAGTTPDQVDRFLAGRDLRVSTAGRDGRRPQPGDETNLPTEARQVMKQTTIRVHVVDYGREFLYMRYKNPVTGKYVTRSTEVSRDSAERQKDSRESRGQVGSRTRRGALQSTLEGDLGGVPPAVRGRGSAGSGTENGRQGCGGVQRRRGARQSVAGGRFDSRPNQPLTKCLRELDRSEVGDPAKAKKKMRASAS